MEFLQELETLALNGGSYSTDNSSVSCEDIARWQDLFGLHKASARDNIIQYRADLFRSRISDELWEEVRGAKESHGYDREAYEYYLFCHSKRQAAAPPKQHTTGSPSQEDAYVYAVLLSGLLDSSAKIQSIAGLSVPPRISSVESEGDASTVCYVNAGAKQRILDWLAHEGSDFKPVFMTFSIAPKQLSTASAYPTLGLDSTLPQHRSGEATQPSQYQFPVWYFFYGTLAEPDRLMKLFDLLEPPQLEAAEITGGTIMTWNKKYKALVDGMDDIRGHAVLIDDQEQEEALRIYESSVYEVVRCSITMATGVFLGLTFRFVNRSLLD